MNNQIASPIHRAWIRLPSGNRLDLNNPDPHSWTDEDLAIRISRVYRWGGESTWPQPLSVAQHSLLVLALRRRASTKPLSAADSLRELLHDAEEQFLGVDLISPLKPILGQPFRDLSAKLTNAIAKRYNLPYWTIDAHRQHKIADNTAAATEAFHCAGWSLDEIRNVLGIVHPILDIDPLAEVYGGIPWEPWSPAVAAERFARELKTLLHFAEQDCPVEAIRDRSEGAAA